MTLARTVYLHGQPLLRTGVVLRPRLIDRLGELGIRTVFIQSSSSDIEVPEDVHDLLSEQTRQQAHLAVRNYMERVGTGYVGDILSIGEAVRAMIDEVLARSGVLVQLTEMRAMNDYVFDHSVGVCVLAIMLGFHAGLSEQDLRVMATGAILHDVGKVRIPDAVWNKPGPLTSEEREMVQSHTRLGYDILRQDRSLGIRAAHVAYQHHERWDGGGYPRKLSGNRIHRFARITSIADVFDSLTTDRPYRPAQQPHAAIEYIQNGAGTLFDPDLVRTFLARVAPYPLGTWVRLNTGERAVVVRLVAADKIARRCDRHVRGVAG